jgi:hypothetical protein
MRSASDRNEQNVIFGCFATSLQAASRGKDVISFASLRAECYCARDCGVREHPHSQGVNDAPVFQLENRTTEQQTGA